MQPVSQQFVTGINYTFKQSLFLRNLQKVVSQEFDALHFFCPTLTPPVMAECVLPPNGFLLPGSPSKTCTFSKQLKLASLGQGCSYNLYCPTSVLKHLHILINSSTHPFTLIYALLYFSCSPPPLHSHQIPLTSMLTPLTILKSSHTFHFPLYSLSVSHLPTSIPISFCDMHLCMHYVMLSACIQFTV